MKRRKRTQRGSLLKAEAEMGGRGPQAQGSSGKEKREMIFFSFLRAKKIKRTVSRLNPS